jgi:hypothetical protein
MARKRLSDLLREEAQKSTDTEAEAAEAQPAPAAKSAASAKGRSPADTAAKTQPAAQSSTSKTRKPASAATPSTAPAPEPAAEAPTAEANETPQVEAAEISPDSAEPSHAETASPAPADAELLTRIATLEATITNLQQTIAAADDKERLLQRQVMDLAAKLDEQRTLAEKLQADVERGRQAEVKPVAAKPASPQRTDVPLKLPHATTAPAQPEHSTTHYIELKKVLQHPVRPEPPASRLSNDDIGWFD